MRRVPTESLAVGVPLPRALYHESGVVLFQAGERVSSRDQESLLRFGVRRLYELSAEPSADDTVTVLPPAPPKVPPPDVAAYLRDRRFGPLYAELERQLPEDFARERMLAEPRSELRDDEAILRALSKSLTGEAPEGRSFRAELAEARPLPPRPAAVKVEALARYRAQEAALAAIFAALHAGEAGEHARVLAIARAVLGVCLQDPDLALALTADGPAGDPPCPDKERPRHLARHALRVAVLSVATGLELDHGVAQLLELAYGALLHPVGLLRMPPGILDKPGELSPEEQDEVHRHPQYAASFLRRFDRLPASAVAIAYQVRERRDGTGYPTGTSEPGPFARVVAAASVFDALSSPRPHREGVSGHRAVRHLALLASKRQLDAQAARAVLKAVGLFPIGTFVRLSDGREARVVAAQGQDSSRPLLAVFSQGSLGPRASEGVPSAGGALAADGAASPAPPTPPAAPVELVALADQAGLKIADASLPVAGYEPLIGF